MEYRALEITLQHAKDLNKVNLITKMDVYAVVTISGGDTNSKQKTKTPADHDGDANPTWDFPMKFTVDETALQTNRLTLDFKLVCERALGDKDVGEVHVPVKELLDSGSGDGKISVSYQVRKPNGRPKGQLTFSYTFGDKTAVAPPHAPPPVTAYPAGPSSIYPPAGTYPPPSTYPAAEGSGHFPPPSTYPVAEGSGHYPPPAPYPAAEGGGHYPPPAPYPAAEGGAHYPPQAPYPAAEGSGHYPPPAPYPAAEGSGHYPPPAYPAAEGGGQYKPLAEGYPHAPSPGYGYPAPPPTGYGYPGPPTAGYGYPPPAGYGYPGAGVGQPPKKNKSGLGLGAGLLGGAIGGLLVGDMISDVADFDVGGFDF